MESPLKTNPTIHDDEVPVFVESIDLALKVDGMFVEVGVHRARGTRAILEVLSRRKAERTLYSVDKNPACAKNHRIAVRESPLRSSIFLLGDSYEVARKFRRPIAWVFIDGAHNRAAVTRDVEGWAPKVIPGGIVLIHDTGIFAVQRGIKSVEWFLPRFELVRDVLPPGPPVLGIRLYRRRIDK